MKALPTEKKRSRVMRATTAGTSGGGKTGAAVGIQRVGRRSRLLSRPEDIGRRISHWGGSDEARWRQKRECHWDCYSESGGGRNFQLGLSTVRGKRPENASKHEGSVLRCLKQSVQSSLRNNALGQRGGLNGTSSIFLVYNCSKKVAQRILKHWKEMARSPHLDQLQVGECDHKVQDKRKL